MERIKSRFQQLGFKHSLYKIHKRSHLFWLHPPQESPNLSVWQQLAEKPNKQFLVGKGVVNLISSSCADKAPTKEIMCGHQSTWVCLLQLTHLPLPEFPHCVWCMPWKNSLQRHCRVLEPCFPWLLFLSSSTHLTTPPCTVKHLARK